MRKLFERNNCSYMSKNAVVFGLEFQQPHVPSLLSFHRNLNGAPIEFGGASNGVHRFPWPTRERWQFEAGREDIGGVMSRQLPSAKEVVLVPVEVAHLANKLGPFGKETRHVSIGWGGIVLWHQTSHVDLLRDVVEDALGDLHH